MKFLNKSNFVIALVVVLVVTIIGYTFAREIKKNANTSENENSNSSQISDEEKSEEIKDENSSSKNDENYLEQIENSENSIYVWGSNAYGQIGQVVKAGGLQKTPTKMNVLGEKISKIFSGEAHSVYLTTDGKVYSWGDNEIHELGGVEGHSDKINLVKNLPSIIKISTSYRHTLALDKAGNVYAWGSNYTGQIGDGSNNDAWDISKVNNFSGMIDITAGYKFSMSLAKNGDVYAWGANCLPYDQRILKNMASNLQQSSSGYYDPVLSSRIQSSLNEDCTNEDVVGIKSRLPKKLDIENGIAVSAGYGHGLILKKDGTVWSFGCNLYGQLGNRGAKNSPENAHIQIVPSLENIKMISAGFRHSLALAKDGTVYMWGGTLARDASDDVRVLSNKEIVKVSGLPKIAKIYGGKDYSLAISEDGRLFGWGSNVSNVLSPEDTKMFPVPIEIKLPFKIREVSAGADFVTATQ